MKQQLILVGFLLSSIVLADIVIMKETGSVLEGKIINQTDKEITIKLDYGEVTIPKEKIKEIEVDWLIDGDKEYEKGNYQEALNYYEKYLQKYKEKGGDRERIFLRTGICNLKLGKKEKAFQDLTKFIEEFPTSRYIYQASLEAGKIYVEKGEKQKAIKYLEKAKTSYEKDIQGQAEYYLFTLKNINDQKEVLKFCDNYIMKYPESEKGPDILYRKAEILYNQIEDKTQKIENIPKYKEITDLLKRIINKNPKDKKLLADTYKLMITCYDREVKYSEKHHAMEKYGETIYPQDTEKQAEWMKQEADKLREEGEIAEAIMFYRFILGKYPNVSFSPDIYNKVAGIFEKNLDIKRVIEEYKKLINSHPGTDFAEKVSLRIIGLYQKIRRIDLAITFGENFSQMYPESKYCENVLFLLGNLYKKVKNKEYENRSWQKYLEIYPSGIYAPLIKRIIVNNNI